jgi:hypothetical protein
MINHKRFSVGLIATAIFLTGATMTLLISGMSNVSIARTPVEFAQQTTAASSKNVVRDSATILLESKSIPAKGFIHLYDITPYMIINGHIAANIPCDTSSVSPLKILIGQAPNVKPAQLELVKPLSTPGKLCIYHVDVNSKPGNPITDIAIQNPTGNTMTLPPASTVVIGVNEISPLPTSSGMLGNMTK